LNFQYYEFCGNSCKITKGRDKIMGIQSQRPRDLTFELSSPAQTLGSSVQIPLEAWLYVSVYSVFVLSCVGKSLATG
jgi:hypothetical protein